MNIKIKGQEKLQEPVIELSLDEEQGDANNIHLKATNKNTGLGGVILSVHKIRGTIYLWTAVPISLGFPLDSKGRVILSKERF